MTIPGNSRAKLATLLLIATTALSGAANATIVRIETVLGDIEINLYDNATPATVANFLNYVENGGYTDSIFHRSVANFILQGGGFATDLNADVSAIPTNAPVTNEPVYSNVRGSIAMAKLGNDPNSATSQWFINLSNNNAANLDNQNGGFTVFGEVTAGLDVVDALSDLPTFAFSAPFGELPLRAYSDTDFDNMVAVTNDNLAIVAAIEVIDSTVDSAGAAGLTPIPTTASSGGTGGGGNTGGGGGGSFGLLALFALLLSGGRQVLMRRK